MCRGTESSSSTRTSKIYSKTSLSTKALKKQIELEIPGFCEHFKKIDNQYSICRGIGTNTQLYQVHEIDLVQEEEAGKFETIVLNECSVVFQRKLPSKLKDPGIHHSFLLRNKFLK